MGRELLQKGVLKHCYSSHCVCVEGVPFQPFFEKKTLLYPISPSPLSSSSLFLSSIIIITLSLSILHTCQRVPSANQSRSSSSIFYYTLLLSSFAFIPIRYLIPVRYFHVAVLSGATFTFPFAIGFLFSPSVLLPRDTSGSASLSLCIYL